MTARLRVVPELAEHHVHASTLTPEHKGRTLTLADEDGSSIHGALFSVSPSLTEGLTVLRIKALGTTVNVAIPDLAPVHVHPEEPR